MGEPIVEDGVYVDADLKYTNNLKSWRGNSDGMNEVIALSGPGSIYFCWSDGMLYMLDEYETWNAVQFPVP